MSFLIAWGPTLLFLLVILWAILRGFMRGFRKSLILAIHSLVIAGILVGVYFAVINMPNLDSFMYSSINGFLNNFGTSFNDVLNVSASVSTLKDALIELIPRWIGYGNALSLVLTDNQAYLQMLVNMSYNLIIAIVFVGIYYILNLFMYLIYCIFYPVRRSRKRAMKKAEKKGVEYKYKKRRILGMIVDGTKGLVTATLLISVIGSMFFIIAGGPGNREEIKLGDNTNNPALDIYNDINQYGNQGIFKILNQIKDKNDAPYYLFLCDIVLKGEVTDENGSNSYYFGKELASYVDFSRNTFDLLLKYDKDNEFRNYLKGESSKSPSEIVLNIMKQDGFNEEFVASAEVFDNDSYLINLSFSLTNSILVHLEELNPDMPKEAVELVNIFFEGENAIKVNDIVTKEDVKNLLGLTIEVLTTEVKENENAAIRYLDSTLPYIEKLSMFNDRKHLDKANGALNEAYDYVLNNTLGLVFGETTKSPTEILRESGVDAYQIDWFTELRALIDFAPSMVDYYDIVLNGAPQDADFIRLVLDKTFTNEVATAAYDDFTKLVGDSKIISAFLGNTTAFSYFNDKLEETLGARVPQSLKFSNIYNEDGSLASYGEIYNLLLGLKAIGQNEDARNSIYNLLDNKINEEAINQFVDSLNQSFNKDETILDILVNSEVMNYVLTATLGNLNVGDVEIIMPEDTIITLEENDYVYTKLTDEYLVKLINDLPTVYGIAANMPSGGLDKYLVEVVKNDENYQVLDSNLIIQATLSNVLIKNLVSYDFFAVTKSLNNLDAWINGDTKGELSLLMTAIREVSFDITKLFDKNLSLDTLKSLDMNDNDAKLMLDSKLIHFSLSKNLLLNEEVANNIIVPKRSLDSGYDEVLTDETKLDIIKIDELSYLLVNGIDLIPADTNNLKIHTLYQDFPNNLEHGIIEGSIIYNFNKYMADSKNITIPQNYKDNATRELLVNDDNLWYQTKEIYHMLFALNYFFDAANPEFDINNINNEILVNTFMTLDEKSSIDERLNIDILEASLVMYSNMCKALSDSLIKNNLIKSEYNDLVLVDGLYTREEIIKLLYALEVLEITDLYHLDPNTLVDKIFILNDRPDGELVLDKLYESKLFAYMCATVLDQELPKQNVPQVILEKTKYTEGLVGAYQKDELLALIDSLESLGITDFTNIQIDGKAIFSKLNLPSKLRPEMTLLDLMFESVIVRVFLTNSIDNEIKNSKLVYSSKALEDYESTGVMLYKKTELKALTDFVNSAGGIDNINLADLEIIKLEELTKNSAIVYATFSNHIIKHEFFAIPKESLNSDNELSSLEVNAIFTFLKQMKANKVSDIDNLTIAIDDTALNNILSSKTLVATISKYIFTKTVLVVSKGVTDVCDDINSTPIRVIKINELEALIKALRDGLGITVINDLSLEDLKMPTKDKVNLIADSSILSQTIISNANINGKSLVVATSDVYASLGSDVNGKAIIQIERAEIVIILNALTSLTTGDGLTLKLDVNAILALTDEDFTNAIESDIIRNILSSIIEEKYKNVLEAADIKTVNVEGYNLKTAEKTNFNTYTKDNLLKAYHVIKTLA